MYTEAYILGIIIIIIISVVEQYIWEASKSSPFDWR